MANSVRVEGNTILLKADYIHVDRCRAVPGGRWDKTLKVWKYVASPAIAGAIATQFMGVPMTFDPAFEALLREAASIQRAAEFKRADDLPPIPVTSTQPWRHQLQAYHFAMSMRAAALFMEMGTGKSKVAVDLAVNKGCKTVLILCPLSVVNVWPKQFRLHAGVEVLTQPLGKGAVRRKVRDAEQALEIGRRLNKPVAIIVNYESAWREPMSEFLLGRAWDMVILDESHKIKAPGGKASLFCARLGQRAVNRLILTGTPMPHSPLDIYAQYRFLDPGIFGTSFAAFRQRYAVMGGYLNREVKAFRMMRNLPDGRFNPQYSPDIEREWNQKLHSVSFRVLSRDVLDLPEAIHETRTFTLESRAAQVYRQLETLFYAEVDNGEVTVNNALTRLLRLQQITSGYVRNDEGQDVQIDFGKMDLLADLLDSIDRSEKVVVFCRFQHDLDTVRAVVESRDGGGNRYGELSGRRNDLTSDSTFPDDVDVLGVQIQAGGVGIDLTAARYVIYYSLGFSLGDYEQSLARTHRPGQTRTTYFYHLLAEGTVDEKVYKALKQRKHVVEAVIEDRG